jgi:HEAT repeat protein
MQNSNTIRTKLTRVCGVAILLAGCGGIPIVSSLAQRRSKETPPNVTAITSRRVANGEVISLAADSALNGIQTWQDPDGSFHLILPGSGESDVKGSPNGVRVRRVGRSLEIEVSAKRGSSVTVEPHSNRLDLIVSGGFESGRRPEDLATSPAYVPPVQRENVQRSTTSNAGAVAREKTSAKATTAQPGIPFAPSVAALQSDSVSVASAPVPRPSVVMPPTSSDQSAGSPETETPVDGENTTSFFGSVWWIGLLLVMGLVGFVFWRRQKESGWEDIDAATSQFVDSELDEMEIGATDEDQRQVKRRGDERGGGQRVTDRNVIKLGQVGIDNSPGQSLEQRPAAVVSAPVVMFGAYRVDQEIGKLVLGHSHRVDVLASRGADDRLALETSLVKALRSTHTDNDGRRRARQALEEYGFVARQSAKVLLSQDPCERVAAARFLGEVGSSTSLQFLLEALYDTDTIVRNQAVESIGVLKLPSAIGALLDIARRYPDVSTTALSNALNACSIDSMEFLDMEQDHSGYLTGGDEAYAGEIKFLEPASTYRDLPENSSDEGLADTLARLQSTDLDSRKTAAQSLAIYRVQRAVSALKELSSSDADPAVRAAAVASLGEIDHESVFSTVLVALADEARDVRAAAARAVSGLSFDRADAYVRVIESSDKQELSDVALACIKTGLAAQAIDRLVSEDRRQAYEAHSILTILVKAGECQPLLDVIERLADIRICHLALQVLNISDQPEVSAQLKQIAAREGIPLQFRAEIMDVVQKIDQMQPA